MTAMTWDALADPAAKRSDARLPRRPVMEATKGRNVQLAVTSGEELSDSECVTRAVDGDARAFEHLYRRHVGRVLGLCLRLVDGDRAKAEQHVQDRSEEHTSELQSLMRISYAVFCLKKKTKTT